MKQKTSLFLEVAAVWTVNEEKLTVYPPARTAEEKIALAERTLEYIAKSVPADKLKPLADELSIDKEWYAKAATPGEKYAAERAIMSVRRRILFLHPDLQFANLLAVQRGLPFSEEAGMTDQYAGRWSRPGPGLVAIENWKSVPHKRVLLGDKLPEGCTLNPCLHWNADRVIFAFNDHTRRPPVDPRKVHAPSVMRRGAGGGTLCFPSPTAPAAHFPPGPAAAGDGAKPGPGNGGSACRSGPRRLSGPGIPRVQAPPQARAPAYPEPLGGRNPVPGAARAYAATGLAAAPNAFFRAHAPAPGP